MGAPWNQALCCQRHIGMRTGRGAWMRFPDVSAKPVSFKERIAGSRNEKESGAVRDADTHPCDDPLIHPVGGGSSHPQKSTCDHVCVAVSQLLIDIIKTTEQHWVHSSSSLQIVPPLALNMLTCCSLDQQSDSVAHPIMRDQGSAEEENLTPCSPSQHTLFKTVTRALLYNAGLMMHHILFVDHMSDKVTINYSCQIVKSSLL